MAQVFVTSDGAQVIPGAQVTAQVQTSTNGIATAGVLMIVGEADAGPDYSLEIPLSNNVFGPDQESAVLAKYRSGPLVDAYRAAINPLSDDRVPGAPSSIILVKTNVSSKASAGLLNYDSSAYATLADKSFGTLGNLIYFGIVAKTSEVLPTTGSFTWIPNVASLNAEFRANGGAAQDLTIGAGESPAAFQAAVDALTGIASTGGALRTVLPGASGNLTVTAPGGNVISIAYTGTFTTTPSIGDTLVIPAGSAIAGAGNANVGGFVVTAATNNSITATKLSDANKPGAVAGTITAPVAVSSTPVAGTTDVEVYAPVVVTLEAGNPSPGLGKSLEIAELTTGSDRLSRYCFALSTTAVTWVSKTGAAQLLSSASEYQAEMTVSRQLDNVSEDLVAGGDVALRVSYLGTTATLTVSSTTLSTTVSGGSGGNLSISLAQFPTINDVVAYINAQTGYSASAGTAVLGTLPSTALDQGTFGICSTFNAQNGRIKVDAYKFFQSVSQNSVLVQLGTGTPARATAGLPAPAATTFLAGGAKGGTTASGFTAAIDALQKVRGNFVVPCFSRDASADIADGLTDSSSTYTIDAIHAYVRSHCLAMSKPKRKKSRMAMLSYRGTFANAKTKAATMNSSLCSLAFLDVKVVDTTGNVVQKQPYVLAALVAGGSAAAGYKGIVSKFLNCSGVLQAAGDWDPLDDSALEDALNAGLLPVSVHPNGGFYFTSDQTTYSTNANPVYNSIQAMYLMQLLSLTTAQLMEDAIRGESVADISAAQARAILEAIMQQFLRIKWIAPSDGAEKGFRNAKVTIAGPAVIVEVEIFLAGLLYFIPIKFLVSQVTQTSQG